MSLGTKGRRNHTADQCKQHLREKQMDELVLVEESIHEIEGAGKERDIAKLGRLTGASHIQAEVLKRLEMLLNHPSTFLPGLWAREMAPENTITASTVSQRGRSGEDERRFSFPEL